MDSSTNRPAVPQPDPGWADLLELPGVEFAWSRSTETGEERVVVVPDSPPREGVGTWIRLHNEFAAQMAKEFDLGEARVTVAVHDEHLLVFGRAPSADVALILRGSASAGMALLRVRQWIDDAGPKDHE